MVGRAMVSLERSFCTADHLHSLSKARSRNRDEMVKSALGQDSNHRLAACLDCAGQRCHFSHHESRDLCVALSEARLHIPAHRAVALRSAKSP